MMEFRAGHATLTKSGDGPGGIIEGVTEHPLAAAERVFYNGSALSVVAVP